MNGVLAPRLVLVTRETEYDALMVRHATRGQAQAFLRRRGQDLGGMDHGRGQLSEALAVIRAGLPKGWRLAQVRRAELDRFLFAPEDVVVAVGQDGLVANLAKYLNGQPVIGVNADPGRNAGILVPHAPGDVAALLSAAAAGTAPIEARTMIRAELDDGQAILALNEVFVGHASHQSARYAITHGGREELQSSSGLIVATGTGTTGWALSIARSTGLEVSLAPDEPAGLFLVREPWPSRATGASIVSGRLGPADRLVVASRMNEGGVVFADGIEHDRLDFAWGRTLTLRVAEQRLRFVPGRAPPTPPAPVRRAPARSAAPPATAPKPAAPKSAAPKPAVPPAPVRRRAVAPAARGKARERRRTRLMLVFWLALVLFAVASGIRSCAEPPVGPPPAAGAP